MKNSSNKIMILLTVIFMDLLTGMEFDLFVPSFPQLQNQFNLSPSWVESLLSSNFIGYCLSLFFVGKLADRFGRKPIILGGLIIFVIGSILCLYANYFSLLIGGRFLQGIGVAAPAVLSFLIIADNYPLKDQQFFIAMLNGVMNVAVSCSPVIGSYLTLYYHWQGNFVALLLMGVISLSLTALFIPFQKAPTNDAALSSVGYGVVLRSKPLMLSIICMLFLFTPYWIFVGMSPLLYMQDLKVTLTYFGYYQGVFAFVFAIGCVIFGLLLRSGSYKQKKVLQVSLGVLIVSFILFALMTLADTRNPLMITLAFLPFIVSQIIPSIVLYPLALNFLPAAKARVSALIQGARLVLTAIGLQIAGYFYQHTFVSIGVIINCFIIVAIVTMYYVIRSEKLMSFKVD